MLSSLTAHLSRPSRCFGPLFRSLFAIRRLNSVCVRRNGTNRRLGITDYSWWRARRPYNPRENLVVLFRARRNCSSWSVVRGSGPTDRSDLDRECALSMGDFVHLHLLLTSRSRSLFGLHSNTRVDAYRLGVHVTVRQEFHS